MERVLTVLTSPTAAVALAAGLTFIPVTGWATWPSVGRGRLGAALLGSLSCSLFAFGFARQLGVPAGG